MNQNDIVPLVVLILCAIVVTPWLICTIIVYKDWRTVKKYRKIRDMHQGHGQTRQPGR